MAETKNRKLDWCELFEVTSASEIFFNCFAQRLKADAFQQHPNFERAETAGQLRTVIPKGKSFVGFLRDDTGVFSFVSKGNASGFRVAIQDAAAISRKVKPFVGIECERI